MTRDEILAMEAGPQLNIALGKALGAKVERYNFEDDEEDAEYRLLIPGVGVWADMCSTEELAWSAMPPLSETWEGMRLVVEALRAKDYALSLDSPGGHYTAWRARIFAPCGGWQAVASTAPHAVALAAMLAVGGGDGS